MYPRVSHPIGPMIIMSVVAHVVVLLFLVLFPGLWMDSKIKPVAQQRVVLDVELVIEKAKVAKKNQVKTPKKIVNLEKKQERKEVKSKKPPQKEPVVKKIVTKKPPVQPKKTQNLPTKTSVNPKKNAPQKTDAKKILKTTEMSESTPASVKKQVAKKDALNSKKLLKTHDKQVPVISDKNHQKTTKTKTQPSVAKKPEIVNDVDTARLKSKDSQKLLQEKAVDVNALSQQINDIISQCYEIPSGVANAQRVKITMLASYEKSGTLIKSRVVSTNRPESTPGVKQMIEAAERALHNLNCNPIGLDPVHYEKWKEMQIQFDPSALLR